MSRLESLMYYFIKRFPQPLGRTMLIKAIYLFDCEWSKSFGQTYTGLEYKRDHNGPFSAEFYDAKDNLCAEGVIVENQYTYPGGYGYEFKLLRENKELESELNILAKCIADDIVDRLGNKDLQSFKSAAYSTPPMVEVVWEEKRRGGSKHLGRVLDMSKMQKSPDPLFDLDEIKKLAKTLDLESRGSDEEYNKVVLSEMNELSIYRERVEKVCQKIGDK